MSDVISILCFSGGRSARNLALVAACRPSGRRRASCVKSAASLGKNADGSPSARRGARCSCLDEIHGPHPTRAEHGLDEILGAIAPGSKGPASKHAPCAAQTSTSTPSIWTAASGSPPTGHRAARFGSPRAARAAFSAARTRGSAPCTCVMTTRPASFESHTPAHCAHAESRDLVRRGARREGAWHPCLDQEPVGTAPSSSRKETRRRSASGRNDSLPSSSTTRRRVVGLGT